MSPVKSYLCRASLAIGVEVPIPLVELRLQEPEAVVQLLVGLGAGLGALAGKVWRIGQMGYASRPENIEFCLQALDEVLAGQGVITEGRLGTEKVLLLKPETFMNLSGQSVGEAMRFFKLAPEDVTVFHDELDLAPRRAPDVGSRLPDGLGHRRHRLVLAHHPLVEDLVEAEQLVALALHQAGDGNAGPAGDDLGDVQDPDAHPLPAGRGGQGALALLSGGDDGPGAGGLGIDVGRALSRRLGLGKALGDAPVPQHGHGVGHASGVHRAIVGRGAQVQGAGEEHIVGGQVAIVQHLALNRHLIDKHARGQRRPVPDLLERTVHLDDYVDRTGRLVDADLQILSDLEGLNIAFIDPVAYRLTGYTKQRS